jgi:hypothetical protein
MLPSPVNAGIRHWGIRAQRAEWSWRFDPGLGEPFAPLGTTNKVWTGASSIVGPRGLHGGSWWLVRGIFWMMPHPVLPSPTLSRRRRYSPLRPTRRRDIPAALRSPGHWA